MKNQRDQNYYSSHPDYSSSPADGSVPGRPGLRGRMFAPRVNYNEAVVPHLVELGKVKKEFEYTMPENSVGIIRLVPAK